MNNSDYGILPQIPREIQPGEVLVDFGCGRGRVLYWWLSRYPRYRLIGVELDPEIAERPRRRLTAFQQVDVVRGSAPEVLAALPIANVIYLANPFGQNLMAEVGRAARLKRARVFCYNPPHLDCWGEWTITEQTGRGPWVKAKFALIKL